MGVLSGYILSTLKVLSIVGRASIAIIRSSKLKFAIYIIIYVGYVQIILSMHEKGYHHGNDL